MGKTKTVYRVQNDKGEGPYCAGDESTERRNMIRDHNYCLYETHPTPELDEGIDRCVDDCVELCGFRTMLQLTDWFDEVDLEVLANDGFFVVEIHEAHITAQSDYQLLFITEEVWKYRDN